MEILSILPSDLVCDLLEVQPWHCATALIHNIVRDHGAERMPHDAHAPREVSVVRHEARVQLVHALDDRRVDLAAVRGTHVVHEVHGGRVQQTAVGAQVRRRDQVDVGAG